MSLAQLEAARRYLAAGFSLIPCKFKKPDVLSWQQYTLNPPTLREVNAWFSEEFWTPSQSIGVILGKVSHNVVAVDLDGVAAMRLFKAQFPHLIHTRIHASGSGKGAHLFYRVAEMPANLNVRTENGGFEIRGNGQYVIAPPSPHPSGNWYILYRDVPIMELENLNSISSWMQSMRQEQTAPVSAGTVTQQKFNLPTEPRKKKFLQTVMVEEIARVLHSQEGSRNISLFYAGLRLANYAASGELVWSDCESRLLTAAVSVGTPEREARNTIASAWRIGSKSPKKVK
jgi:hypothetical protein